MATKLVKLRQELNSYSQAEEDALASTLTGQYKYASVIWNETLQTIRFWNEIAFVSSKEIPKVEPSQASEINDIELQLKIKDLKQFKELIYTGSDLTQTNIWTNPQKTTKVYQSDYTYSGGNLTTIQIKRIFNNYIYTKHLSYDGSGNLESINITIP